MKIENLKNAYGGLLHDIGKFAQRTLEKSDLTPEEKALTPFQKKGGYHTHLHSGYTSRFFREELKMYDTFEKEVSEHHLSSPTSSQFAKQIVAADRIASKIDRSDERSDQETKNEKGTFQTVRLSSILGEVNFGKPSQKSCFSLSSLSQSNYPSIDYVFPSKKEAVLEYSILYQEMLKAMRNSSFSVQDMTFDAFNRMYALLYEYTTFIPASTYEGNETYVSLFDHLKLTSAIASCLEQCENKTNPKFYMLEFDLSGIQKFIFKVTEGAESKSHIVKSLRGRSLFISLITDYITYSYLHAFDLSPSNIIFNTGGGAVLLLPSTLDFEERVQKTSKELLETLYRKFHTDITFVYAVLECDQNELEQFKTEKAIVLKDRLEKEKFRKFQGLIQMKDFFVEKPKFNHVCELCESVFTEQSYCEVCQTILDISDFFVRNEKIYVVFDFDDQINEQTDKKEIVRISMGSTNLYLMNEEIYQNVPVQNLYVESINHASMGNVRYFANMVPFDSYGVMSLEKICGLIPPEWGDQKLGILKMDVDDLGAIFAYGLDSRTRSLSKFLTLSRLMELFFGNHLERICLFVSKQMNPDLKGTMFYINYAGGDDLVVLGPAAAILYLAQAIDQNLNQYTHNRNVTISGGLFIQKPKEPIRFGVQKAEEYLTRSKNNSGKNSITLLDTTCTFAEYGKVLEQAKKYRMWIREGKITRTNFYNIMSMLNVKKFDELARHIPILFYSLKRNIGDTKIRSELIETISKLSANSMHELEQLVLTMKLAIIQTRGD
ncbi:CRISPR-associated protein cas10/csm1, subtype III-a/mtube [Firmicutes bacterium M10-2]|nr:CRISPR-associated protein cas10/csm1, subtype III-a/mtube [Firmicutes bacterium M10-2]